MFSAVFFVSVCSLTYELIAGAIASYLLGNSITQFSLVIGLFLAAMGIGSWLSKYIVKDLITAFVAIEVATGTTGGFSALILFAGFTYTDFFYVTLALVTISTGTLIGLELPLIIRILQQETKKLEINISNVMTADYLGALAASLLFPFILAPSLGLLRASFLMGLMNLGVGLLCIISFKDQINERWIKPLKRITIISIILLAVGFTLSGELISFIETQIYPDEVIYAKQTLYQRIVITRWRRDFRLFLDGKIQFSSVDEYRYHECLVHPPMTAAKRHDRILILGGGDGMAVRELLKYKEVKTIDLVDIDPEMTMIFQKKEILTELNNNSLNSKKLTIHHKDAMSFLEKTNKIYDVILVDLPDPNNLSIGKLYSQSFYQLAARRLSNQGIICIQSSSPYYAAKAYWCVINTLSSVEVKEIADNATMITHPFHVNVPAFGEWGYVMASRHKTDTKKLTLNKNIKTRFLNNETLRKLFIFPEDLKIQNTKINTLNNQILVSYYDEGYANFYE